MYKLIRDKIPEIMEKDGKICNYATAETHNFYFNLLCDKLHEEAEEARTITNAPELLNELADLYEIISALAESKGESISTVKDVAKAKKEIRGGFEKKYIGFFED